MILWSKRRYALTHYYLRGLELGILRRYNSIYKLGHFEPKRRTKSSPKSEILSRFIQMQRIFNILQLKKEIISMKTTVFKMVNSLGKTDGSLTGPLLETPGKSKWVTRDAFYLYPCFTEFTSNASNWYGNTTYKHGRQINKTYGDLCFSIAVEKVQQVKVFRDEPLWFDLFDIQEHRSRNRM